MLDVTGGSASATRKNSKQMAQQRAQGIPDDRSAGRRRRIRRWAADDRKFMSLFHSREMPSPTTPNTSISGDEFFEHATVGGRLCRSSAGVVGDR